MYIHKPKITFTGSIPSPCLYNCTSGGGCTVQYTGPPRGGPTAGSCFPPDFGGSCSGTPPECKECKNAVDCYEAIEEEENNIEVFGGIEATNEIIEGVINPEDVTPVQELNPEGRNMRYK